MKDNFTIESASICCSLASIVTVCNSLNTFTVRVFYVDLLDLAISAEVALTKINAYTHVIHVEVVLVYTESTTSIIRSGRCSGSTVLQIDFSKL
jgi:hypothetical protein